MGHLYALQATHPAWMSCELLKAQNALIEQSRDDTCDLSIQQEWGLASLDDGRVRCFPQVQLASSRKGYRRALMRLSGTTLLAHVQRATVGTPRPHNTHPFRHEDAFVIHNGHMPASDEVRPLSSTAFR